MRTAADIVRQEVIYCVSSLVSTLTGNGLNGDLDGPLGDLCEQAAELSTPIPDYEEAAREAGWRVEKAHGSWWAYHDDEDLSEAQDAHCDTPDEAWRSACDVSGIEPHDREVYEHWIVTDWLADKLEAKGEKVDRDFAGMIVWARTTTGQSVSMDGVMQGIAADLAKQHGTI